MRHLWEKVQVGGLEECWPWTASRRHGGYGQLRHDGRVVRAHRLVYLLAHGELAPVVRHACDNPACCNPLHLLGGTQADNARDREARGRGRSGIRLAERTHCARGHLYDAANTHHRPRGGRECRTCARERMRRRRARP